MKKDYYEVLGVPKDAPQEKIKEAYRRLAHKYHPDKSGGDEKKFKEINEAYQILSDAQKRAQYDHFGHAFDGANFGGQNPFGNGFEFNFGQNGFDFGGMSDLSDIFETLFEGMGVKSKRRSYSRGADLEFVEEIFLEESFRGIKKTINYETFGTCSECQGLGYFEKQGLTKCSNCDGKGEIRETRRSFFGNFSQVKACPKCSGTGQIPNKICGKCSGKGRIKQMKTVDIYIAPGTTEGQLIKITGAGETGEKNAGTGDLFVRIRIKPHHIFQRSGDDLLVKKELNLLDVLLEKKIEIPSISGNKISVEIPKEFDLREKLVIHGEGMPKFGSSHKGNLYVEFHIKTPKKIDPKLKKFLEDQKND
ncbi:MAG: DnaJ C-terminal domain-containing protein [Candidatus Pacebacteria bacterium]|nr:DnaJ C-terminal domain-containing protein [Candidatus Paceibacterota bacterium]